MNPSKLARRIERERDERRALSLFNVLYLAIILAAVAMLVIGINS